MDVIVEDAACGEIERTENTKLSTFLLILIDSFCMYLSISF